MIMKAVKFGLDGTPTYEEREVPDGYLDFTPQEPEPDLEAQILETTVDHEIRISSLELGL